MHSMSKVSKFVLIFGVGLALAACSDKPDESLLDKQDVGARDTISTGIESEGLSEVYGPDAGTQADLVTNVGDRVFFGYDRFDVSPEAREILERQAKWMMQYPSLSLTIEGHADERGTREYNLALGEKRANAVKNYLIALGVDPFRLVTISYGKERPAVPGANDTAWAQNRRAVTKVN